MGLTRPTKSYFLCTSPRSGSTFLCTLLRSSGVSGFPESYFHKPSVDAWLDALDLDPGASVEASLVSVINAAIDQGTKGGIFGARLQRDSFDFFMEQLKFLFPDALSDAERFRAAFGEVTYVYLSRQDKLAQAISLVRAKQTGLWHRNADGSELERLAPAAKPVYDPRAIQAELNYVTELNQAWEHWFASEGIVPLRLSYENLVEDPKGAAADVFEALGLPRASAKSVVPGTAQLADEISADWTVRFTA